MDRKLLIVFLIFTLSLVSLFAEGLDATLERLSGNSAQAYVGPIVSSFGSDLNGGWFHKSPKDKFIGLDFEIGVVAMGTFFGDEDDYFSTTGTFRFNRTQASQMTEDVDPSVRNYVIDAIMQQDFEVIMQGPTVVGPSDEHVEVIFPGQDVNYVGPGGVSGSAFVGEENITTEITGLLDELPAMPLAAPQVSIGTFFGTMLTARFIPAYDVPDLGEISYLGLGLQHNIKAWLPLPIPVDISLAAYIQTLKLGEYVTAKGFTSGLTVSKTFGPRMFSITPYAGYMLESSNMEFSYEFQADPDLAPINIDFKADGKNKSRLTLGSSFRLGIVNLNADYNIGDYNSVTVGLAFAF
ncbi:MAG: hypothetical protein P9X26_04750 [Candidatus Stygibacter frigidus]|nr:hypothetical protein [Candidatus Stygibacter frigidus]